MRTPEIGPRAASIRRENAAREAKAEKDAARSEGGIPFAGERDRQEVPEENGTACHVLE